MRHKITTTTPVRVRFGEVDSLGIVWHGHYIKYFEDGREDFGRKHGLSYLDFKANEYATPIVKCELDYKQPARYGDIILVETTFTDNPAAKLIFEYKITNQETGELLAKGKTIEVFTSFKGELSYVAPDFFLDWKKKMGILE